MPPVRSAAINRDGDMKRIDQNVNIQRIECLIIAQFLASVSALGSDRHHLENHARRFEKHCLVVRVRAVNGHAEIIVEFGGIAANAYFYIARKSLARLATKLIAKFAAEIAHDANVFDAAFGARR